MVGADKVLGFSKNQTDRIQTLWGLTAEPWSKLIRLSCPDIYKTQVHKHTKENKMSGRTWKSQDEQSCFQHYLVRG